MLMVALFLVLNMKNKPVLVVEGVSDMNRLNNLIDADYVICNGSAISKATILYIKELVKTREVIVLTDPDYPGMQIRNKIAELVPEVKHAFVDRKKASNGKKLGVAECEKEELLRALNSYVSFSQEVDNHFLYQDLVRLKLTGDKHASILREAVANYYRIGHVNAKTFLKRINMLGVTTKDLEEVINDLQSRICDQKND